MNSMKKLFYSLLFVPMLLAGCDDNSTTIDDGDGGKGNGGNKPAADFVVSPEEITVDAEGDVFDITVTSVGSYELVATASWINELTFGMMAVRPTTHTFRAARNSSGELREGLITFLNDKGDFVSVTVKQGPAAVTGGEVVGDWRDYDFVHHSLLFDFTGTWCGFCPMMAGAIERVQTLYPGRFYSVPLHGGGSDLDFSATTTFANRFGVKNFPTSVVDCRRFVENLSNIYDIDKAIISALDEQDSTYPVVTGAAINSKLDGYNLTVDATAYFKEKGTYKVYAMVLESGIRTTQTNYQSGDGTGVTENFLNDHVARLMLTSTGGVQQPVIEQNEEHTYQWTGYIDSSWNQDNLEILVYIEREFGTLPKLQSGNYGNYFVDNCAIAPIGVNYTLKVL